MTDEKLFEKTDVNFWAYERLDELVKMAPEVAFEVVLAVLMRTDNEEVLENVAAGPLEDLVRLHGEVFFDRFEM